MRVVLRLLRLHDACGKQKALRKTETLGWEWEIHECCDKFA